MKFTGFLQRIDCISACLFLHLTMAYIFICKADIADINKKIDIPAHISYSNHQIEVNGKFKLIRPIEFSAKLSLAEFSYPDIVLNVDESEPAFGSIDNFVKSIAASFLRKKIQMVKINYPAIRVDLHALPQVDQLEEQVDITDIRFEADGIRVDFALNKNTTWTQPAI